MVSDNLKRNSSRDTRLLVMLANVASQMMVDLWSVVTLRAMSGSGIGKLANTSQQRSVIMQSLWELHGILLKQVKWLLLHGTTQ
ncbi:hypothetical protein D3C80_2048700 [compost metagenome]